ncbi:MAG: hypothetical protein R3E08_09375 [Thiotrichaceae bacterium]
MYELKSQLVNTLSRVLRTSGISKATYDQFIDEIQQVNMREEQNLMGMQNAIHHWLIWINHTLDQHKDDVAQVMLEATGCNIRHFVTDFRKLVHFRDSELRINV